MGLSAVHQLQSPQKPHLYNHSHQLKMVDTNEQQPPTSSGIAVPCLCKDYVPAVKVSKMRVFKKIKKKIGLTPRSSSSTSCPNNLPPLQFHHVHGDNVRICPNGTVAKRYESFCKGIAFSARPVKTNERVHVKFSEISNNWSGVIRFGFTFNDPATLRNRLPNYACPDLTNRPGYWAKALHESFCKRDNILFYYVTASGDVHFGINGVEKGVLITGVETQKPLWTLIDIYGNCTAVEFVDSRVCPHHHHNVAAQLQQQQQQQHSQQQQRSSVVASNGSISRRSAALDDSHIAGMQSAFQSMSMSMVASEEHPATATLVMRQCAATASNNAANEAASFVPMPFHRTKGRNVMLSGDRLVATRAEAEFCQGYVFTARPVRIGERYVVQVLRTEHMYVGALALGLTSCDPAGLLAADLPDDADMLLDRPEYWVVSKDVAAAPSRGDELSFCVQPNGEVQLRKNGGAPTVVMHVDQSLQLWAFLDVYGSTQSVRMLSQAPQPVQQQQHQQHQQHMAGGRLQVQLPNSESMNSLNSQMSMLQRQQQMNQQQLQLQLELAAQQQHNRHQAEMQRKVHTQVQQQQQQQQMSCMAAATGAGTSNHNLINVPTTNGDMIQIQQGGTVLVVNLPPTQHSSVSDLSASQPSLAITMPQQHQQQQQQQQQQQHQQIAQAILHQQQHQQQHLQHHTITVPTRIQALSAVPSCSAATVGLPVAPVQPMPVPTAAPITTVSEVRQSCANQYPEPVVPQDFATLSQWQDAASAAAATSANLTAGAECTICYEHPIDSVLYMCGHMCMCYECAIQQWRGIGGGHCPLCRAVIRDVIRTYKS